MGASKLVVKLLFMAVALCVALCSGFYFWYTAMAADRDPPGWVEIVIYIISAIVLIAMGALGVILGWMEKSGFVNFYWFAMGIMLVFSLIQLIAVAIALASCDGGSTSENPFGSLCTLPDDERWKFWFPTITILVVELLATITGFIYKKLLQGDGGGKGSSNYY